MKTMFTLYVTIVQFIYYHPDGKCGIKKEYYPKNIWTKTTSLQGMYICQLSLQKEETLDALC